MELIFSAVVGSLSLAAVLVAARKVYRTRVAQQELISLLSQIPPLGPELVEGLRNPDRSKEALRHFRDIIEGAAAKMEESDRRLALEGLRQPSEKGRADYIVKLATKADVV